MALGAFVPHDVVVRPFNAFLLENPRGPIGMLAPCQAEQEFDRKPRLK
jgi:hypothetical protein